MMEWWSTGVMEYWSIGVLEYWSIGVLEWVQMKMQMRREIISRLVASLNTSASLMCTSIRIITTFNNNVLLITRRFCRDYFGKACSR